MNSFMSWLGGKKALRDAVLARFPPYYERYIEVFGGAGWVLFHKPPGMDFEVYNDFNSNLANLYRCVRDKPNRLKYKLRYVLDSREDFDLTSSLHKRGILPRLYDVDRAAKFYQLIRYSYASGLDSFASQPHSIWSDFPMIDLAARRLQKVVVENKDFEKLIKQYDRPVSFFYCDPPYFATENYYKDVGFTAKDHIRLRDALLDIKGRFLVSYNDCPEIREIWHKPNIHIEEISRLNNLAQRYDGGCQYAELLISNYDTSERAKAIKQTIWRYNFMRKIIFAQVLTTNGTTVFSGLFDENENPVSVETGCDDSGVTLTIWRNAPETERRDCGISEEEIERTCSMYDDCNECPLWDYCNEDEEVL